METEKHTMNVSAAALGEEMRDLKEVQKVEKEERLILGLAC
jgi:hypothetical protein